MKFEWDEAKNEINIRKHHIDFADIGCVFDRHVWVKYDTKKEYDEDRWIATGFLGNTIVVVVYVERKNGAIRIISGRKADKDERKEFEEEIKNRLGISSRRVRRRN